MIKHLGPNHVCVIISHRGDCFTQTWYYVRHEKRSRRSDAVRGNFRELRKFFVIWPRFSPIIESLAAVISHICGNKCSRNHLWMFPTDSLKQISTKYTKIVEIYQKPLGRQVQLIDILCSVSGRYSRYFEEILNPQKSV